MRRCAHGCPSLPCAQGSSRSHPPARLLLRAHASCCCTASPQGDERRLRRMMDATSGQGRPFDTATDTALGEAGALPSAKRAHPGSAGWLAASGGDVSCSMRMPAACRHPGLTRAVLCPICVRAAPRCALADRTLASSRRDEPTNKEQQVAAEVAAEAVRPGAAPLHCAGPHTLGLEVHSHVVSMRDQGCALCSARPKTTMPHE